MTTEQLFQAAAHDINYWYMAFNGICPNCHEDLNKCHPAYNIYPHFTAACVEPIFPEKK